MTTLELYPQPGDPLQPRRLPTPRSLLPPALAWCWALGACGNMVGADDFPATGPGLSSSAPIVPPVEHDLPPPARTEAPPPRTNPFVMATHDPLSTFATDADTASYDLFARLVDDGALPEPAVVRLEDYVNYFEYAYPTPLADADPPFSIALAAARHPLAGGTTLLRVGLQGKAAPEQQQRPTSLTFLVDTSGSMQSSDKLPLVQQVLRQSLDLLAPDDSVAIVSYAGDTRVRLPPTPVAKRNAIVTAIDQLDAAGSTAGASGIQLAYAQAEAHFLPGGINHVVLCTDGDFNVGVSDNQGLVELITEKRRSGITLTALGFGTDNLNDDMLEAVSNAGNGFYGYIGSERQAAEYVHERLLSTLTLIAKDVKVQVEFNPVHVQAYRLLGYEDRDIADRLFRDDAVDAGEVGAGHRVTALYELVPVGASLPQAQGAPPASDGAPYTAQREVRPDELVLVKLRYKAIDATESDPAAEVASSLPPLTNDELGPADADLAWAYSVAAFAEILKRSPYAREDQLEALDAVFAAQAERDRDRAEFYRLFSAARRSL